MKRYEKPETKTVRIQTANLCTTSTLGVDNVQQNNISGDIHADNALDIWGDGLDDEE